MKKQLFLFFAMLLSASVLLGQDSVSTPELKNNAPSPTEFDSKEFPTLTIQEYNLSIGILFFSAFVLFVMAIVSYKKDVSAVDFFRYASVVIVITGSLFLITAGYGKDQISPVIGLLGTVVGFIIGKSKSD